MKQWNSIGGQYWWNSVVEQWDGHGGTVWWNIDGGTVWWKSGRVMVEHCGGTVEQCGGTVWWNSGTVMVGHCGGKVEQCGGTVKQSWWNSVVEQWNIDGGTV